MRMSSSCVPCSSSVPSCVRGVHVTCAVHVGHSSCSSRRRLAVWPAPAKGPTWTTAILWASRMVDRRWAMTSEVRPAMSLRSASCTRRSLAASRALLACTPARTGQQPRAWQLQGARPPCCRLLNAHRSHWAAASTGGGGGGHRRPAARRLRSVRLRSARGTVRHAKGCATARTSSRSRILGSAHSARAMAMRCFCPPDRLMPPASPSCGRRHPASAGLSCC